jgi:hypothetical protein
MRSWTTRLWAEVDGALSALLLQQCFCFSLKLQARRHLDCAAMQHQDAQCNASQLLLLMRPDRHDLSTWKRAAPLQVCKWQVTGRDHHNGGFQLRAVQDKILVVALRQEHLSWGLASIAL